MRIARIFFHAAVISLILHLVELVLTYQYMPVAHLLLAWVRPGGYLVFAVTMSCLLNRRPLFLLFLYFLGLSVTIQDIIDDVLSVLIAALLGCLAALVVRALVREAYGEPL